MSAPNLEFCLSGGAAHGLVMSGALAALRDRGVVPNSVTGISSGAVAAALTYGYGSSDSAIGFFERAFDLVRERGASAMVPPYSKGDDDLIEQMRPFVAPPITYREHGLQHLWIGAAVLPTLRFETRELLGDEDHDGLIRGLAHTSMMPFMTHNAPHLQGRLDGAFRKNHFTSPTDASQRWLFTYARKPFTSGRGPRSAYDRVVLLDSPFWFSLHLSRRRLRQAWHSGYAQGQRLAV
ncbi:MAG: hypothetical protein ACI9MC_003990 [Kiritimatiellia bacterium]|jgi:hypothetical protein